MRLITMWKRPLWHVWAVGFLCIGIALCAIPSIAQGQIFVAIPSGTPQNLGGAVSAFNLDGTTINPTFISSPGPIDVAIQGSNLFVLNGGGEFAGSIGEFTTAGATIIAQLTSGFFVPKALAVAGSDLLVTYGSASIGKYTTTGTTINDQFVQGLNAPFGVAISDDGAQLFVATGGNGMIGKYNATTGAAINASLIAGLNLPTGIAISGNNLFVANSGNGTIGKYNLDGTTVNTAFITGLSNPLDVAEYGGHLYVVNNGTSSIGEYNAATGATINATLITGLSNPQGIAVVPEPATWILLAAGCASLLVFRRRFCCHS
jgi:DNA-binding beta-propeller fold protein YncE